MYKVKNRIKWLNKDEITELADQLVEEFSDGKANDQLKELINSWTQGEPYEGKQIYVKNLLGAMSTICPELVSAILKDVKPKKQSKFRK